jgi:hypothetical protein
MRRSLLVCGIAAFLVLGCDDDSDIQTRVRRPVAGTNNLEPTNSVNSGSFETSDSGGEVQIGGIVLVAPRGWRSKAPQSVFTAAEYVLPGANGPETDGRLTLSVVGGSIADNVERWKAQFGGAGAKVKQETLTVDGMQITVVDCSGDFNDQRGPYAPAVKRSDYRMKAAIIPVNGELHFIKAIGPRPTIEAYAESIKQFIQSAKKTE